MKLGADLEAESKKESQYWSDRVAALQAQLDLQKQQNVILEAELAQ